MLQTGYQPTMTRQFALPPSLNRRGPCLGNQEPSARMGFGELAGETAAECVAVCCCCPCGLVNLLVLTVYKVPAGLCRKALKKRKHRRKGGSLLPRRLGCPNGCDDNEFEIHLMPVDSELELDVTSKEVVELDKEMWDLFYETGFWRSHSQLGRE
ncbi:PREDICTED: uncharacterized protein LOC109114379 [Nelumbo nucifera]|uniref:Uncharacterized protein LOC109114379 n=2 Tax=Nelumbo nucifera TaxID=4432 RepID=A0A1U8Q364_NELNU|nr:PREDICTED: uncharacterized protein LOC109114379 [Nelumbo nucifera]DAD44807.1 TPA_asm: hypothetical protein HUJ06_003037 [Nelumbo nucifera]